MIQVSLPNKTQIVHGVERAALAFVVAAAIVLRATNDPTSKAGWVAAVSAGAVAVYQLVLSTLTTL